MLLRRAGSRVPKSAAIHRTLVRGQQTQTIVDHRTEDVTFPREASDTVPYTSATYEYEIDDDEAIEVTVNGLAVNVPKGCYRHAACEIAGVTVPRFCYHDRLSIAGNCRMCLVEVEKAKKPVASCAMPLMPGMKIRTSTPLVKKAREGVLEFLLVNHPLDCPICDQGGECDLQDQYNNFGAKTGRFFEAKRAVENKDLGPFVKTVMNRCIHCTRCVRYADEICGTPDLGTTGRGNATEIGTYVEKKFDSEMSGNVIDLCPVGALTNRPAAFTSRSWENRPVETIDTLDATGANIVIDTRGNRIIRIKPRLNEDVNEEWISDRSRFSMDGLARQRLDLPLIRDGDEFQEVTWPECLGMIKTSIDGVDPSQMKVVAGDQCDLETMTVLKDMFNTLGCNNTECRSDGAMLESDLRSTYILNSSIPGLEEADLILIVGTNPRMEAPLVNTKLRKCVLNYGTEIGVIGHPINATFRYEQVGLGADDFVAIANGTHDWSEKFRAARNPVVLMGMSAFQQGNAKSMYEALEVLGRDSNLVNEDEEWNGIGFLHTAAARVGGLDIGFVPGPDASDDNLKFLYLQNADDWAGIDSIPDDCFVVYQGSHGDRGAAVADVILPGCTYTEKNATYVNMDGRPQRTKPAVGPVGHARVDWQTVRALSEYIGVPLPYNNVDNVRERMYDISPGLRNADDIEIPSFAPEPEDGVNITPVKHKLFTKYYDNFFKVDPITRASKTMSKATKELPMSTNSWK